MVTKTLFFWVFLRLKKKKGFPLRRPVAWVKSFPAPLISLCFDSHSQYECIFVLDYIYKDFQSCEIFTSMVMRTTSVLRVDGMCAGDLLMGSKF